MYSALVKSLTPDLSVDFRDFKSWERHESFGNPDGDESEYLVEFDISSCYEYVNHGQLRDELLLRTMRVSSVEQVTEILYEISGGNTGLPQLFKDSDILADVYLEVIERELLRSGHSVSRFADDFKISVSDWGTATEVIEDAAEIARGLGLILSTEKTKIRRRETLAAWKEAEVEFFDEYFHRAKEDLTIIEWRSEGYGFEDWTVEIEPSQQEIIKEALMRILEDWCQAQPRDMPLHSNLIPVALRILADSEKRIPDVWLLRRNS